jgi:hypothetical protein
MSKNSVLAVSIISLIISAIYSFWVFTKPIKQILFVLALVSWFVVPFVVFNDAKKRNKKYAAWGGLCFLLGGIGGLIYYATIFKEEK